MKKQCRKHCKVKIENVEVCQMCTTRQYKVLEDTSSNKGRVSVSVKLLVIGFIIILLLICIAAGLLLLSIRA